MPVKLFLLKSHNLSILSLTSSIWCFLFLEPGILLDTVLLLWPLLLHRSSLAIYHVCFVLFLLFVLLWVFFSFFFVVVFFLLFFTTLLIFTILSLADISICNYTSFLISKCYKTFNSLWAFLTPPASWKLCCSPLKQKNGVKAKAVLLLLYHIPPSRGYEVFYVP